MQSQNHSRMVVRAARRRVEAASAPKSVKDKEEP